MRQDVGHGTTKGATSLSDMRLLPLCREEQQRIRRMKKADEVRVGELVWQVLSACCCN